MERENVLWEGLEVAYTKYSSSFATFRRKAEKWNLAVCPGRRANRSGHQPPVSVSMRKLENEYILYFDYSREQFSNSQIYFQFHLFFSICFLFNVLLVFKTKQSPYLVSHFQVFIFNEGTSFFFDASFIPYTFKCLPLSQPSCLLLLQGWQKEKLCYFTQIKKVLELDFKFINVYAQLWLLQCYF